MKHPGGSGSSLRQPRLSGESATLGRSCLHSNGVLWLQVGAAKLRDGVSLNYAGIEGFRIAGNQGLGIIVACQVQHAPLCGRNPRHA